MYVLMGNDVPCGVFDTEEQVNAAVTKMRADDRAKAPPNWWGTNVNGAYWRKWYWVSGPFTLNTEPTP